MASEEEGKVEMDSLFEGMVLFNPSQMPDDDQLLQELPQPQPNPIVPQTSPPADSNWVGTSLPASQPLDENLFSDLTLVTPSPVQNQLSLQPQSDTPTTSSTSENATTTTTSNREVLPSSSSVCRQISSRKKRRAGLRIGYGRDVPIPDDQTHGPAAVPATQQHADGRLSLEPELPPPPPSSFTPESESDGSAPQPQLKEHGPPTPDPQIATLSFTPGQPVRPSSTTALEGDFPVNTPKEVDPSHASAGNGSQDDDNLVLDAQHSADLQAGNHQLSTHSPIELMRSEQIRAQISQKLRRVRELIASVSAARKGATRRRRNAAEALNLASSSYRNLEKALEEACEAEDFETAERVSESLASAEKEKESLAIALRLAEADCDSVDAKMQEVLEWQIAAEEECASLLKNFAMVSTISVIGCFSTLILIL